MSDLDYDALRKVAEAATPGPWDFHAADALHDDAAGWVGAPGAATTSGLFVASLSNTTDGLSDGSHIATFDPPTVLRLLDLAQRAEADRAAVERVKRLAWKWESDDEESLNTFGQHLMGGSVLTCAEQLRAALDRKEDQ